MKYHNRCACHANNICHVLLVEMVTRCLYGSSPGILIQHNNELTCVRCGQLKHMWSSYNGICGTVTNQNNQIKVQYIRWVGCERCVRVLEAWKDNIVICIYIESHSNANKFSRSVRNDLFRRCMLNRPDNRHRECHKNTNYSLTFYLKWWRSKCLNPYFQVVWKFAFFLVRLCSVSCRLRSIRKIHKTSMCVSSSSSWWFPSHRKCIPCENITCFVASTNLPCHWTYFVSSVHQWGG